ncbi:MAG: hypothetical protein IIB40_09900 [Candidatus Marinimicrobia bacterium]|nr:hypothetical protein [Candidatus Neomarinimicrobiota bacterium]
MCESGFILTATPYTPRLLAYVAVRTFPDALIKRLYGQDKILTRTEKVARTG